VVKYLNKPVIGSLIGNIMEFYDFVIYGYLSVYLSSNFFPSDSKIISLLVTFGVFAGGYIVRPLGALLFGYIGDVRGRKPALLYSIILMSFSTLFMGIIPSHKQIGILAPVTLTGLRLLQGLAVSGEQGGIVVYISEYFKMQKIGFISSLIFSSILLGVLLGCLAVVVCQSILSEQIMYSWGWRVPFCSSSVLGLISLKLRLDSAESPLFRCKEKVSIYQPAQELITNNLSSCIKMFLLSITFSVVMSFHNVYLPVFYSSLLSLGPNKAMLIISSGILLISVLSPMIGCCSEKIGYTQTSYTGCLMLLVLGFPLFCCLQQGSLNSIILAEAAFAIIITLISAPMYAVFVQSFPKTSRYTGVSIVYNLGMSIFASLTPLIAIGLSKAGNLKYLTGVFLSLSALGGIISFKGIFKKNKLLTTYVIQEN